MKKIIHYDPTDAGRLHCDACGYDLPEKQPFTSELIGTPCPKCGADMLTREDFLKTLNMFAWVDTINIWLGWLIGTKEPPRNARGVAVRHHGNSTFVRFDDPGASDGQA